MKDDNEVAMARRQELIESMIAEAIAGPYVHEECGDTLWDDALAEHKAKKEEE